MVEWLDGWMAGWPDGTYCVDSEAVSKFDPKHMEKDPRRWLPARLFPIRRQAKARATTARHRQRNPAVVRSAVQRPVRQEGVDQGET